MLLRRFAYLIVILAAAAYAAWELNPWPSALFYRYVFDKGGVAMDVALAKHVPAGVSTQADIPYGPDPIERLDVHVPAAPASPDRPWPTVVWIHGGGFLSGDKNQIANYLKIVAAAGHAVVGVNYTLAPSARHPRPTQQVNAALTFLRHNAGRLKLDAERIFLAGDSAGAQIAAQLAIAISEPRYAELIHIRPAIPRSALRGIVLHCGIHDPDSMRPTGAMAGFLRAVSWSYFGSKDMGRIPPEFSIVRNVAATLPPLFVSAGNADPLLPHSQALVAAATKLGVQVDPLFFPGDHNPPLKHEYEFDLDVPAGRLALERSLKFIANHAR